MKIKINTGLIATNGDGKPNLRPPIPAGWCRPLAAPNSEEAQSVKLGISNSYKADPKMSENLNSLENKSEDHSAGYTGTASPQDAANGTADTKENQVEQNAASSSISESADGDSQLARETTTVEPNLHEEQNNGSPVNQNLSSTSLSLAPAGSLVSTAPNFEVSSPLENTPKHDSLAISIVPSSTENEDSNVDVETEEQLAPLEGSTRSATSSSLGFTSMPENANLLGRREGDQLEHLAPSQNDVDNCLPPNSRLENMHSHEQKEETALAESDAQYIEKQVVNSFLQQERPSEFVQNAEIRIVESPEDTHSKESNVAVPPSSSLASSAQAISETPVADSGVGDTPPNSSVGGDTVGSTQQPEKIMDALSMTIASVAAGEGEPPEYISKYIPDLTKSKPISPHRQGHTNTSNKHKKSRADRPMSASARLPVISSLLAPTSVASHQTNMLPGIQHIAPSGRASNSPNTVLPSVAHFLGPAKSPPSGYNPHQQQPQSSTPDLLPSMGHQPGDVNQYQDTPGGSGPNSGGARISPSTSKPSKGSRKPVTPAGLRLSMAASEELPDPLPVPQYSDKVIRAKQLGTVAFDRPTVLRETVQFFLQYKHYWSSHDYDRISNLVIELFPEFKDNSDTPGVPANKRIRTDLSMYARNFRRREVSQKKKDSDPILGTPTTPIDPIKSDQQHMSPAMAGPSSVDNKSFLHAQQASPSPQQTQLAAGAVAAGNAANSTDFCNELLTAASIIESQNTTAGGTRNGEMAGQISQNHHKTKVSERELTASEATITHRPSELQETPNLASGNVDGSLGNNGYHTQQQRVMTGHEDGDSQPIHFVYDKATVPAAASRDANAAWQMYNDQMAQAMATGNPNMDYGMTEEVNVTTTSSTSMPTTTAAPTDRLSAMAMWRSTTLPDPLPTPHYSDSVTRARESGNTMSARPKIIRETTQFFLALKLWWTAPDYERIAELVLKNFPALVSLQAIKKDLGTCARNMRRRLPAAKYKPGSSQQQKAAWSTSSSGAANNPVTACGDGMEATQSLDASGSNAQTNPAEYMKALMAAQGMNLSELGMSQRNLGELAVLAGIKQRIEQHPAEVSDLERQYLAQCSTEERQALLSSGAFSNDSTAMAALSAFYGQLGVEISPGAKRGQDYPPTTVAGAGVSSGMPDGNLELLSVPNKRQRRVSQAEVEKRLREAELNHVNQQGHHHLHHFQQMQQQQQHLENVPKSSHQGTVGISISDKHLVKREPSSPTGVEGLKNRQQHNQHHSQQTQHHNQHHPHQQLTVPSPVNMSNFSVSTANGMGGLAPISSSSSVSSGHDQAYWDSQTATNMALMGLTTCVAPLMATQAHSQAQVQHLSGHPHPGHASSHGGGSHEVPMNLTYQEPVKTESPSSQSSHTHHRHLDESPSVQEPLPDTAGLAAQVEVTTSAVKSPRRRASSSPRSGSQQGDASQRDQVWYPHGQGFKKENQEVVCLPDPLPVPEYTQKIAAAREEGTSMRHRSEIIRETARFFLGLKYWWSSADYTRISELVVEHFPDLKDDSTGDGMNNYRRIQRDLSMCARNLRRSKKPRKMRELSSSDLANSIMIDGDDSDPHHPGTVVEPKKRPTRPKGTLYGAAAERKAKRQAGASSTRSKKAKLHQGTGQATSLETAAGTAMAPSGLEADVAGVGVTEDMAAAAALMQQQFMQQSPATSVSSSGYISQHPSAHLLPTAHLMPSLHTHPALQGQHIQQMNASLLQQEGASITVEEAHSAKRLVKEEPGGTDSLDHTHTGIKANMVVPMQRALSPTLGLEADGQANAAAELAKQRVLRDMESGVISREDAEKLSHAQVQPTSTLKVYMDPEHGSDLQERFSTLWRKGKFFDASLGVANKKLHVHKLVLLAMSPYLQETFKNADPRSQLEVNLPSDTTYETAKAFLKYIYEGVLEVDTSSVRSLHKIATMLQMNKLAQYCQNFAQQLQEEAEQALQRLGETQMTSDLHRAARYATEEHLHFKAGYLGEAQQAEAAATQPHFLHQDALAQHRALVAASSPTSSSHQHQQHHHHHQQQNSGSSELLLPTGGPVSAQDLATQHLIQAALVRHQAGSPSSTTVPASSSLYQQQEALAAVPVSDTNSALLQRLTSPALSAFWQAQTLTELMSRGGVSSDPSNQSSASELAAIAAAAAAATTSSSSLPLSSSSEDQRLLGKGGGRGSGIHPSHHQHHHHQQHHHQHQQQQHKDNQQWAQHADDAAHHHASMLPETCLPGELSRGNS